MLQAVRYSACGAHQIGEILCHISSSTDFSIITYKPAALTSADLL